MPGVSSEDRRMMSLESYMPASFFNANGNGDVLPVFEEQQMCSPRFMSRDDINFLNGQRFLAKSLSFGSNPSSNGDDWPESFTKDEAYEAFISSSAPAALVGSSSSSSLLQSDAAFSALQKFLPSNNEDEASLNGVDAYSCDEFRMYDFKVRRCMRGRSHDWTECPFAHPGEKARRRDPRRFLYSGTACPDFRKGTCRRGDACEFAHGVFECWLHPGRYRTQPCKDGRNCRRRVCFFAHTPEQLRLVAPSASSPGGAASRSVKNHGYDGSPLRHAVSASASFDGAADVAGSNTVYFEGCSSPRGYLKSNFSQLQMSSPTSTLVGHSMHSPPSLSPPMSPAGSPPHNWPPLASGVWNASPVHNNKVLSQKSPNFANIDVSSAAQLHASLGRRHPSISIPPSHDGIPSPQALSNDAASPFSQHSPRAMADLINTFQHLEVNNGGVGGRDASSLWLQAQTNNMANAVPVHTCSPRGSNLRHCSYSLPCTPTKSRWENKFDSFEVEEPVQRVESGRDLRAKIYGRLSMENPENSAEASPDLGWVNELVK